MQKFYNPARIVAIFVVLSIFLAVYIASLYRLQLVEGDDYQEALNTKKSTSVLTAARGDILDRNGVLLVSSRSTYNVTISRSTLLSLDDPNDTIFRLVHAAVENGVSYTDSFPVTIGAPFAYLSNMTSIQETRLSKYFEYFDLNSDISASDLIIWMKNHYGIDYTTNISDARLIIGIRYELEVHFILNKSSYIFAEDVDTDFISIIKEQDFPGVNIVTSSEREYNTDYASHILGSVGYMNENEYEIYSEQGYSLNTLIGKEGVEQAFESYLHGTDGSVLTTTNSSGAVVNVETIQEPVAGKNVYLTIDIGMQEVAEDALADLIATINDNRSSDEEMAEGGAVVVVDVNSGEVLTSASYPTYSLLTYKSDYTNLAEDETQPLFNRATQGTYNPGSTFKMVTALAGLRESVITRWSTVTDMGKYTVYPSFQPSCWIYSSSHTTHGTLDIVGALQESCNYFFYWLGDHLGINAISSAASDFGLGSKTGLEIFEVSGTLATPEYKETELNEGWWAADTLITAIGQGHNMFTPVQMADYIATIANGGTLYSLTLLKTVKEADYLSTVYETDPEQLSVIDDPDDNISILQEGMRAVALNGTASSVFSNYPVPVAAKTGTVQSDTATKNNAVFVCYAPVDDPEIAIVVLVEKGGSGSTIMSVAKKIMDYYFASPESQTETNENTLLP